MDAEWTIREGTGWIALPGFGRISPRRDNVGGGRYYFTAQLENDEYAEAVGESISEGPETWHYEPDSSFLLGDHTRQTVVEMTISVLPGGRYGVRYRPAQWPATESGAW